MRSKGFSNKDIGDNNINIDDINNNKINSQLPTLMEGSICSCLFLLYHGKNIYPAKVLGKTHPHL